MNLYMVYLGGDAPNANIELHDVRFVVGDKIDDTYPQLINDWFGTVKGLHLDSYKQLKKVENYRITLQTQPSNNHLKLYFINFGGYRSHLMAEQHQFGLFVAQTSKEAIARAKQHLMLEMDQPHKDDVVDVDDCIELTYLQGFYVQLEEDTDGKPLKPTDLKPDWYGYRVIGK